MGRKRKRKGDHDSLDIDWCRCTKHARRVHPPEYVQKNWNHKLVLHPGNNLAEAAEYASQPSLVPTHRDDIKWLPQSVVANWKRIHPESGKLTTIKLDGCEIVVASRGLQKAGIDTARRKGQAASAIKRAATNMADKGKRSIPTFAEKGGGIAQLGLRYRKEEKAHSKRPKLAVSAPRKLKALKLEGAEALAVRQKQEDLKFTSCMNDVRNLCTSTARVTMSFMAAEVAEREATLQSVAKDKGSVTSSYPSVQIGVGVGTGIHQDSDDMFQGTWGCLGPLTMALPEYEALLELQDGDVLSFPTDTLWHCIVRRPSSMCQCVCLSLYYNKHQHERFCENLSCMQVVDASS
jgi:hypothetical protein